MGVCVNANTAVVPANAGTHTLCPTVWAHCPIPSVQRTVIASAAKQSILPLRGEMDCFAALAMTTKHTFTPSPRNVPEALKNLPPKEGVGNAGCPLHPRPRVHLVLVERTRATTSTPESPDVPARNGFNGFLRALPGDAHLVQSGRGAARVRYDPPSRSLSCHLNGMAYIKPPLLHVAFRPRSSLSGLALPTLRSKISA